MTHSTMVAVRPVLCVLYLRAAGIWFGTGRQYVRFGRFSAAEITPAEPRQGSSRHHANGRDSVDRAGGSDPYLDNPRPLGSGCGSATSICAACAEPVTQRPRPLARGAGIV